MMGDYFQFKKRIKNQDYSYSSGYYSRKYGIPVRWSKAPAKRSQHFNATLLGATCCVRLAILLRRVVTCWVLLAVKFFMQHFWMLHYVVVV